MVTYKLVKTRLIIALLLFLSIWLTYQYMENIFSQNNLQDLKKMSEWNNGKIKVSVYYECLCPDSKSFIINHVLPSYERAANLIELELIPYGKAETRSTSNGYEFECQHGPSECLGNKVHACLLAKVGDVMNSLRTVACLLEDSGVSFGSVGLECAKKVGINWDPIMECATGTEGSQLLKAHGDTTNRLSPKISFVPTVLLNNQRDGQPALLKNLWKEICTVLPETTSQCL